MAGEFGWDLDGGDFFGRRGNYFCRRGVPRRKVWDPFLRQVRDGKTVSANQRRGKINKITSLLESGFLHIPGCNFHPIVLRFGIYILN